MDSDWSALLKYTRDGDPLQARIHLECCDIERQTNRTGDDLAAILGSQGVDMSSCGFRHERVVRSATRRARHPWPEA